MCSRASRAPPLVFNRGVLRSVSAQSRGALRWMLSNATSTTFALHFSRRHSPLQAVHANQHVEYLCEYCTSPTTFDEGLRMVLLRSTGHMAFVYCIIIMLISYMTFLGFLGYPSSTWSFPLVRAEVSATRPWHSGAAMQAFRQFLTRPQCPRLQGASEIRPRLAAALGEVSYQLVFASTAPPIRGEFDLRRTMKNA